MSTIGPYTFPGEIDYDPDVGELTYGDVAIAHDTPEGHFVSRDHDTGEIVGVTLVYPDAQLEREGALWVTLPDGQRVRARDAEPLVRAAAPG